jgi:hypothetical protein
VAGAVFWARKSVAAEAGVAVEALALSRLSVAHSTVGAFHVKVALVLRAVVVARAVEIPGPRFPRSLGASLGSGVPGWRVPRIRPCRGG